MTKDARADRTHRSALKEEVALSRHAIDIDGEFVSKRQIWHLGCVSDIS